jgi:hypothetical protein
MSRVEIERQLNATVTLHLMKDAMVKGKVFFVPAINPLTL